MKTKKLKTRKIEIERVSFISSKPFDTVVAAVRAGVGRLDLAAFSKASKSAGSFADLEKVINQDMGKTGLMLFLELDHGSVLKKEMGPDRPKMVRFVIGNPLVMKEMVKHVPDAGSYAPITVLVDERPDGIHLTYDRMVGYLSAYKNAKASKVAQELDAKVEALLNSAAG